LFEENRKYIKLNQISENMINAIVAVEDKNFWTNPGIDIY
jgi:membrane peptidoglycan carboxypeptidase